VSDTLAVIAARRGDQARRRTRRAREAVNINDSAAKLERAHRAVVFVLDPDFGPGARTEQRPSDLRRWSDRRADNLRRGDQLVAPRQGHSSHLASPLQRKNRVKNSPSHGVHIQTQCFANRAYSLNVRQERLTLSAIGG